jgi:hypothetical protein
MRVPRIDEIVELLEAYALGEIDLPEGRMSTALALFERATDDEPPPPDDGNEEPASDDNQIIRAFSKIAA